MLEDWEELADGRLTGSLSGSEVWIVPGARSSDDSGRVTITSAAGRPYVLGVPRTERAAPAPDSALARLEALLPETPSVVVRRYIEGAPPAIREAMRERDAGFLRVAVGVAVLAYAFGVYVGSGQLTF